MSASALLVTGGSRGIGRACALLAAENGWAVGVNYREDAKAADAVVETIAKGGGRVVALKGDVSVEADAVAMFDAAARARTTGQARSSARAQRQRNSQAARQWR